MGICDGRVVIVTGSGRGIGREHALAYAREGAKVVVNDLGGDMHGDGGSLSPAMEVVEEIKAMGGEAVADGENVADFAGAGRMVQRAIDTFGHLDTLVNNAGILPRPHAREHGGERVGRGDRGPPQGRVLADPPRGRVLARPGEGRNAVEGARREHVVAVGHLRQRGSDQLRRGQGRHRRVHDHLRSRARPLRRLHQRDRAGGAHAHDREPRLRRARRRATWDALDPANISPLVVWLGSNDNEDVSGRVFLVDGDRVSVAEGWHRGPTATNNKMRWEPAQLTKVVPDLVAEAAEPSNMLS